MKATKIFTSIAILIILFVVAVVAYVFFNLNYLVKDAVETYGPQITQTAVNLKSVDIKPLDGSGELKSLVIDNPEGFDGAHLLKASNISLQIDTKTVSEDVIVIKDIAIDGVNLLAIQDGLTTNIQKMLNNLKSASGSSKEESPEEESETRFMVENLRFQNNSISLNTEAFGSYSIDLPEIVQSNIGTKSKGLTPTELGLAIIKPFMERAKDSAEDKLKSVLKNNVTDKAKAQLNAKVDEKKAEVNAKVDEKKAEVKEKLKEKLGDDAEEKLKSLKGLFGK